MSATSARLAPASAAAPHSFSTMTVAAVPRRPGPSPSSVSVARSSYTSTISVSAGFTNAGSGGLAALQSLDVSTLANAQAALGTIETLSDTAIDAAAAFGSDAMQIDIQAKFVSKLTDALKSGIGSMVDADMEEASAKLQALQVQQQLAIQSLSIANQAPQNVLSLFR